MASAQEQLLKLKFDKGSQTWKVGNKPVTGYGALQILMEAKGYNLETQLVEGQKELETLKTKEEPKKISDSEIFMELESRYRVVDRFKLVVSGNTNSQLVYIKVGCSYKFICSLNEFSPTYAEEAMLSYFTEDRGRIFADYRDLIESSGKSRMVTPNDAFYGMFHNADYPVRIERIHMGREEDEPSPCILEGMDKFALEVIPYTRADVKFEDLNEYLQDLFNRMEGYEYICAYLWRLFTGRHNTELIYLKGGGGDGKSAFVTMLEKLTGSAGAYGGDKFQLHNMYGKAIISKPENKNPRLLDDATILAVTGGDLLRIEEKNKNIFSGRIRGMIFVTANQDLILKGISAESRRLRYFKVAPGRYTELTKLDNKEYTNKLNSTPNEFLNFCRVCYEKLATSNGIVPAPPNHSAVLEGLLDLRAHSKFRKVFDAIQKAGYSVEEGGCVDGSEIVDIVCQIYPDEKNLYLLQDFDHYMEGRYNVTFSMGKYYNLRKLNLSERKTNFKAVKGIKEAMPV